MPAFVGVNTTTPGVPLDVVDSISASTPGGFTYFNNSSAPLTQTTTGSASGASIRATGGVLASYFAATSDERIKNITGHSDSAADLRKLLDIEVTDFLYKDVVGKGNRPQKKVIAQQVEKGFPQAVSHTTDVVPDIYQKASVNDGWVELATDLKAGDRVRLITEKGAQVIHEVLEVRKGGFRTDLQTDGGQVFVYGREVKDFRVVDYEAIAMLNVSATQELARKGEAKDAEIAALKKQLAEQAKAIEARLARLERFAPATAVPVKLALKK